MIDVRGLHGRRSTPEAVGPTAGLASPVWHRQGPAARYGRCRQRFVIGA
jgi:hypothetical protein